jgi:hypothetical protein
MQDVARAASAWTRSSTEGERAEDLRLAAVHAEVFITCTLRAVGSVAGPPAPGDEEAVERRSS